MSSPSRINASQYSNGSPPRQLNRVKVVMIGDSGVGKTALTTRFTKDDFTASFHSTVGVELASRSVVIDNHTIECQIWDTPGKERYRGVMGAYYGGALAICLTYDITDAKSFDNIRVWLRDLEDHGATNATLMLLGNKSDLANLRVVDREAGRKLASEMGMQFMEVSALDASSIDAAFQVLLAQVYYNRHDSDMETSKVSLSARAPVSGPLSSSFLNTPSKQQRTNTSTTARYSSPAHTSRISGHDIITASPIPTSASSRTSNYHRSQVQTGRDPMIQTFLQWEEERRNHLTMMSQQLESLELDNTSLHQRKNVVEREAESRRVLHQQAESAVADLEDQLRQKRHELQIATQERRDKDAELTDLSDRVTTSDRELTSLRENLTTLKSEVDSGLDLILTRASTFREEAKVGGSPVRRNSPTKRGFEF